MLDRLTRSLPVPSDNPTHQWTFLCLAGSVSLALVSIAASQILLAGAIAGFCGLRRVRSAWRQAAPVLWPLLAFFLWSILAALVSSDVLQDLRIAKKFCLFPILFLVPALAGNTGTRLWIYRAVFGVAAVSAAAGLLQFAADPNRDALHRISGFLGHWMSFSGTLMLVLVALAAYAIGCGLRKNWWTVPLGLLVAASIYFSQTRSALLGATAGLLAVLLLWKHYRAIAGLVVLVAAAYVLAPGGIQQRLQAGFDPNDPNTRNRIELFGTAARLIRDNPWFGVGPKSVGAQALRYRGNRDYPDWMYQHMHNNFLQIAAERGLPGLLLWLWLMLRLAWDSLAAFRGAGGSATGRHDSGWELECRAVSAAAVGAWVALLVAGMFEYNFGDSEVLMLFLFMMGAPYATERPAGAGA